MKLEAQILGILFILICSFSFGQVTPDTDSIVKATVLDSLNSPNTLAIPTPQDSIKAREIRIAAQKAKTDSIKDAFQFPTFGTQSPANNPEVDQMLVFAKKFLGTPYRWGGTTPSGFDCSGFIYYIMGNFGFSIARTSFSMSELGRTVKISEARPGDLMFFKGRSISSTTVGHVGMVYEIKEDGVYIIHASSSRGVVIENFSKSRYLIPRYLKVKRLDYGEM